MSGRTIGFAVTGSFCTHEKIKKVIEELVNQGEKVIPVFSPICQHTDSRFGKCEDFIKDIQEITKEKGIFTIPEAEPIGPKALLDILVIAPCTGNTLAKLSAGIADSTVLMAAKAHLRNDRPVVIGVSTNDGLGANFQNIGSLMNRKNMFFIPFGQDDFIKKPNSLVAHWGQLPAALDMAEKGGFSDPRNPTMLKMLSLLGFGERAGSGIPRMNILCNEVGLPVPKFEENYRPDTVTVRIVIDDELTDLNDEIIIDMIRNNPKISITNIAEKRNVDRNIITRKIERMKVDGMIERVGGTRGYWKVR